MPNFEQLPSYEQNKHNREHIEKLEPFKNVSIQSERTLEGDDPEVVGKIYLSDLAMDKDSRSTIEDAGACLEIVEFPNNERYLRQVALDDESNDIYMPLNDGDNYVIGRNMDFPFVLPDTVSREHMMIRSDGEHVVFRDLDSTNGTVIAMYEKDLQSSTPEPEQEATLAKNLLQNAKERNIMIKSLDAPSSAPEPSGSVAVLEKSFDERPHEAVVLDEVDVSPGFSPEPTGGEYDTFADEVRSAETLLSSEAAHVKRKEVLGYYYSDNASVERSYKEMFGIPYVHEAGSLFVPAEHEGREATYVAERKRNSEDSKRRSLEQSAAKSTKSKSQVNKNLKQM